ncbi:hypothetical protein HKD37_08G022793 [Glycine soja]
MDQPYGEVNSSGNMHSVTYNQDLLGPTLLAGWAELRDFYGLTGNHQVTLTHFGQSVFFFTIFKSISKPKDVPSTMYLFMKAIGFTHLNLEGITECRIVYNHWKETTKIGN